MTKDEALKLALEALTIQLENSNGEQKYADAIAEIEALAQPVQEPDLAAAYMSGLHDGKKKRPWVGLTDDDILQIRENVQIVEGRGVLVSMTIAIEQALKEKNT